MGFNYILVVDDNPHTHNIVAQMLKTLPLAMKHAFNGHEALALATADRPDLIILDMAMPDMDGHELLAELGANPQTSDVPVIIYTALSLDGSMGVSVWPAQVVSALQKVNVKGADMRELVANKLSLPN